MAWAPGIWPWAGCIPSGPSLYWQHGGIRFWGLDWWSCHTEAPKCRTDLVLPIFNFCWHSSLSNPTAWFATKHSICLGIWLDLLLDGLLDVMEFASDKLANFCRGCPYSPSHNSLCNWHGHWEVVGSCRCTISRDTGSKNVWLQSTVRWLHPRFAQRQGHSTGPLLAHCLPVPGLFLAHQLPILHIPERQGPCEGDRSSYIWNSDWHLTFTAVASKPKPVKKFVQPNRCCTLKSFVYRAGLYCWPHSSLGEWSWWWHFETCLRENGDNSIR